MLRQLTSEKNEDSEGGVPTNEYVKLVNAYRRVAMDLSNLLTENGELRKEIDYLKNGPPKKAKIFPFGAPIDK
jgi:hypothetical protein